MDSLQKVYFLFIIIVKAVFDKSQFDNCQKWCIGVNDW